MAEADALSQCGLSRDRNTGMKNSQPWTEQNGTPDRRDDDAREPYFDGGAQARLRTCIESAEADSMQARIYDGGLCEISCVEIPVNDGAVDLDEDVEIGGALELTNSG